MADLLDALMGLHRMAARFGDGLKPELVALATRDETLEARGAVPLSAAQVSAGPKHQFATVDMLRAAEIPVLTDARRQHDTSERSASRPKVR